MQERGRITTIRHPEPTTIQSVVQSGTKSRFCIFSPGERGRSRNHGLT